MNLFLGGSSKDLDNLYKLINSTLSWENRLPKHKLSDNTANAPDINGGSVIWITEDELWCSIVSWTNVRNIRFPRNKLFCRAKVTKLENMAAHITKDVLGLDITMADALCMNISNASHQLVWIKFNNQVGHLLLHFMELFHHSIRRVWDVVHHNIQVNFVWLISICVETLSHLYTVGMMQHFKNCQLSIFVPFVLEHFLDRHSFPGLRDGCFEYYTKGTIPYNFFSVVGQTLK